MSQPQNKREKAMRQRIVTIITGVAIFFLFLHVPKAWDGTAESIEYVVNHMFMQPFDIFPLDGEYVGIGFILSTCTMLLMYQHFLDRRNLRPDEESGSAKWNEDIRGYYYQYADGKLKFTFPKPKGNDAFSKTLRNFLKDLDKILLGWSYELSQDTKAGKTWSYSEDEKGNRFYKHTGTKNMILSQDVALSMDTRQTLRNNNILVIGGSGTGKSRFMIKPNMLQANCSFVITDPSGELLESMGSFLKEKGYDIRVFNLVQMDHSHCYNPFHYIRNEEGVLTMINALIKNTTPKGSQTNDPFWEKAETALLQAICFYLMAECNPDDQNFNSVMKLLRCVDAGEGSEDQDSVLDVLMNDLREKDPEHIALQSYAVFKSAGGGKTAQSILISCQTRLQVFNLSVIKNLTNTDNIDLKTVGDKPTALFCITPVVDTTFNFLVALLYTQLFETLYFHAETECNDIYHQGLRLPVHVRFLLDEFANIGSIPEFSQKLATMRKYEISCTIVIQALSQLKAMYKDDWEVLVGNCDTQIFLGGTDKTTLEYVSQKLGKETIRAENSSRSFGRQGSSSVSYNKTGRELLQMDEIARMDNLNCIVFIRGVLPFFTKKYDYPKHPNYKMTGDADDKLGFDVKRTVDTAVATATPAELAQSKRKNLNNYAEKTDDTVTRTVYEHKKYKQTKEEETIRRNQAILKQETSLENEVTLDVSSMEDAVEKNDLPITAEQLEERIFERYQYDGTSQLPDEFATDEDLSSDMEVEVSVNTESFVSPVDEMFGIMDFPPGFEPDDESSLL